MWGGTRAQAAQHELYWSVGDGGPQNDPFGNAQDKTLLHGSIIRILVPSAVGGTGYEIPTGNAFDGANGEWCPRSTIDHLAHLDNDLVHLGNDLDNIHLGNDLDNLDDDLDDLGNDLDEITIWII